MSFDRRRFISAALVILAVTLSPFAGAVELTQGENWRLVSSAPPGEDDSKIEVLEFFSYGCPHCADLNPLIEPWAKQLPSDVEFTRVPVTFNRAAWISLARLFYALELTGDLERLDQAIFDAVTKERINLYTDDAVLNWAAKHGVDRDALAKMLSSFAVEVALARAGTLADRFQVNSVPTIIVDGRYEVLGKGARTHEQLLEVAGALIAKARETRDQGQD